MHTVNIAILLSPLCYLEKSVIVIGFQNGEKYNLKFNVFNDFKNYTTVFPPPCPPF